MGQPDDSLIGINHSDGDLFGIVDGKYHSLNKDNYILMQYTGLKDRHGKDIYEGDIVAIKDTNNHVVHFHNGMSGWFTGEKESICQYGLGLIHNQSEVIGNVLENEELLNL